MKRIVCCFVCLLMFFSLVGCNSNTNTVRSGSYYAVGDYEEMLTPYLWLDIDKGEFCLGRGAAVSYSEYGSYDIVDGKIIATSQSTTYIFKIKDKNTLVLIDNGEFDFLKSHKNVQFVYSEEMK